MTTLLGEPFEFLLIGKKIDGFSVNCDKLDDRLKEALEKQGKKDDHQPDGLAYIFAYSREGCLERLPRPAIFIVRGDGAKVPARHGRTFPDDDHRVWRLHPRDEAARFDVELGPIEGLLDLDQVLGLQETEPEGATVLRGADGRLYCIPANLDACEVRDDDKRSMLELADGTDLGSMRVTSLTARSALTVRSALTTRSAVALRSAITLRSALQTRSALTLRSAVALRSALAASAHDSRDD